MIQTYLDKIAEGKDLRREEASGALEKIVNDELSATEVGALLMGLRIKGESIEEISGFIDTMEKYMVKVKLSDQNAIDVCGTGGDGRHSFNVSTTTAFVVAAGGVTVAKHGNRSVSSKTGSADLLEALGIRIDLKPEQARQCADEIGLCFFFAPNYHPAMKNVVPHRKNLGVRTVFNMLGPLLNPAQVKRQLVGVYDLPTAEKLARVLEDRRSLRACTVHSADGFDELSPFDTNHIFEVEHGNGGLKSYQFDGRNNGASPEPLVYGADRETNAEITLNVLRGRDGSARIMTVLNSALAFYVADRTNSIKEGVALAEQTIDEGGAMQTLTRFREITNDLAAH